MNTYTPNKRNLDTKTIEIFVLTECKPIVNEKINILADSILRRARFRGMKNFGPEQARELALRMFQRTLGEIVL